MGRLSITAITITMLTNLHALGATPAEICRAGKNKEAGLYSSCRQQAEAKFATTGDAGKRDADFAKCAAKIVAKWQKLEAKAAAKGSPCPTVGDQAALEALIDDHTTGVASALAGGAFQGCGADLAGCQGGLDTCNGNLGTCGGNLTSAQGALATCTGNLATCNADVPALQLDLADCNGDLATCNGDLSDAQQTLGGCTSNLDSCHDDLVTAQGSVVTCTNSLASCNGSLGTCQSDLATCQAAALGQPQKTGQDHCYDTAGAIVSCTGTGNDGELQKGLARSFTDNGNGTITDNNSGLMWEKLSDDGSIHDSDTTYTWTTAVSGKIAALNTANFAGHNDWRLPNAKELLSLLSFGPAIYSFPAFSADCTVGCNGVTCSCTHTASFYLTSTTYKFSTAQVWMVSFSQGLFSWGAKTSNYVVRAVRGGI